MRLALLAALALAACGPTHPLTYVHPGDPVWWLAPPEPAPAKAAVVGSMR